MEDVSDFVQSEEAFDTTFAEDTATPGELDKAIQLLYEAIYVTIDDTSYKARVLNNLGVYLRASGMMPEDNPDRAWIIYNLALNLETRYKRDKMSPDIEEAIKLTRIALDITTSALPRAKYLIRLGQLLYGLYPSRKIIAELEEAIRVTHTALTLIPDGPDQVKPLAYLGMYLYLGYWRRTSSTDLDEAIRLTRIATQAALEDDPYKPLYMFRLGSYLSTRYSVTEFEADLEGSIEYLQAAIDNTPEGHASMVPRLAKLARQLSLRYLKSRVILDLDKAIQISWTAVNETKLDSQMNILEELHGYALRKYLDADTIDDLNELIRVSRARINVTPLDDDYRAGYFATLGTRLRARYGKSGRTDEWDQWRFSKQLQVLRCDMSLGATQITSVAVMATPEDIPMKMEILNSFVTHLSDLCLIMDTVNFSERVVGATRAAFNIAPTHHLARLTISKHLAESFVENFKQTSDTNALNEAILVLNAAINAAPDGHCDLEIMLSTLRSCLIDRYTETGELADFEDANNDKTQSRAFYTLGVSLGSLEEAIRFSRRGIELATNHGDRCRTRTMVDLEEAIQVTREAANKTIGNLNKAPILDTLGYLLDTRFESTDSIADIHEAVQITQEVVSGTSSNPIYLNSLCTHLSDLSLRTGKIAHLEEAIRAQRAAVVRAENDDREWSRYLHLLGYCLYLRYSEIEVESDLEEAIQLLQEAGDSAPEDSPHKAIYLTKLSMYLGARHKRTGAKTDLDEAIRLAHFALAAAPKGHPSHSDLDSMPGTIGGLQKAIDFATEAVDITLGGPEHAEALNSLGLHLAARYKKTGEITDVEEAVRITRIAVDSTPKVQNKPQYLKYIALYLRDRYEKTRLMAHLNETIQAAEEAVDATPNDHPDFAEVMGILGVVLEERYSRTCATPDLQRAILCHQSALEAGIDVLRCSVLIVADLQHVLSWAAGLASDAAATALNAAKEPYAALDLLEQGRGLLATSLEEMRTDILSLREKRPDLAEEFVRLRGELNLQASRGERPLPHSRLSAHLPLQVRTSEPYQTDKEFDQLLVKIRSQPDFATFLLPPSREEMMQAALNGGPIIVINVSKYRSDAILVERDQIRAVALPRLQSHDVENKTLNGEIGAPHTLAWLWDIIAKPVLDALRYTSRPSQGWPRVWWIPIGPLSRFPLHAAGLHEQGPGEAVIYRALIRGRQRPLRSELSPLIPPRASEVLRDICKAIPVDFVDPGQLRDDIMAQLPGCSIFHFAGHGCTDSVDPSQSHLRAYDGKIAVAALLEMNLRKHSPFLAYLSACGTGWVRDDAFLDESIYLISACQLAGFSHVIGTLWGVKDKPCTEMARLTYEGIRDNGMTDDSVCLGLHNAARALRNRWLMGGMEENYREYQKVPAMLNACPIAVRSDGEGDEGRSRFPRDIIPLEEEHPAWIPYVHFGV
ncbi:hypothetical protein GGR58DRAFT_525907 [Xylaria digitata]|nr:hypothetical protein GGR58DRAFT_525907 [Xylaria digitata]